MIALVAAPITWLLLLLFQAGQTIKVIEQEFPVLPFMQRLRWLFLSNLVGVSENAAGLVAGLTIGERSEIDQTLADQMRSLGLTHLVAVSGANLAIIAGSIYFIAAKASLPRNFRFAISALLTTGYVLLVGPESSVIRAYAMTIAVLVSYWIGRGTYPVVALSWAVLVILLLDPSMATNIGFALSAFATLGLLVLAQPIYELAKQKIPPWLALGIAATVAAQISTWPIILLIQPGIASYSIFANLLVEPVVAPVTILGVFSVVLVGFFPWGATFVGFLASIGTFWIEQVSKALSSWPLVRLPWIAGWLGIALAAILALAVTMYFYQSKKFAGTALIAAVVLVATSFIANDIFRQTTWLQSDWDLVMCDVGQGDGMVLRSQGRVAVIDVGKEDAGIDNCLAELGISHIDLLVLSHFDKDHAGGIGGALKNRTIDAVIVSGLSDDRPLVSKVENELARHFVQSTRAQPGLQGRLGIANWKILAPTATATEAKDANDASVVILFEFEQFSFLATGDLGEHGQKRLMRYQANVIAGLEAKPLILKVSHHGSKDQSASFHKLLGPELSLISVGKDNDYGHPTAKTLGMLKQLGSQVVRTDLSGAIGVSARGQELAVYAKGRLSQ